MCGWMYRYVGGAWMVVSVGGKLLVGCVDGCVGRWVVVVWIYEWMCR